MGTEKLATTYCDDDVAYCLADQNPELSRVFAKVMYEFCKKMIVEWRLHRIKKDGGVDGLLVPSENLDDYVYSDYKAQEELERKFSQMNPAFLV